MSTAPNPFADLTGFASPRPTGRHRRLRDLARHRPGGHRGDRHPGQEPAADPARPVRPRRAGFRRRARGGDLPDHRLPGVGHRRRQLPRADRPGARHHRGRGPGRRATSHSRERLRYAPHMRSIPCVTRSEEEPVSSAAQRLRHVLAGQQFPADRWQLIVGAEFYGADAQTRNELQALPPKRYVSLAEVLSTIDSARARRRRGLTRITARSGTGRTSPAPAGRWSRRRRR